MRFHDGFRFLIIQKFAHLFEMGPFKAQVRM